MKKHMIFVIKSLILILTLSILPLSASASCEDSAKNSILLMNGDGGVTYEIASSQIWLAKGNHSKQNYRQVVGYIANYSVVVDGNLTEAGSEFISAECDIYSDPSSDSEMIDINGDGILNLSDMKRTKLKL